MPAFKEGWGPGIDTELDEGDSFEVALGAEKFDCVGGSFTVGPISTRVTIRKGEGMSEAYARARAFMQAAFQAEFEVKKVDFFNRLEQLKKLFKK